MMAPESKLVQLATSGPQSYEPVVDSPRRRGDDGARDQRLKSDEPFAESLRATKVPALDYLEGLELVNRAAQAMQTREDHSQQIQAKAFELMQQARSNRLEAAEQIASLQEQLAASERKMGDLAKRLAHAEQRARTAEEWLERFVEAINAGFASRRACRPDNVHAAA
jgi:hypothetical protein